MKDMPTFLPDGLTISTLLPREDVRDSFVSRKFKKICELPKGCVVGTSSLRRKAQLLTLRPDLNIVEFRGNVQTRLRKLDDGIADATFLACAGLTRLNLRDLINPIETNEMLPAVAQGAIGIEQKSDNEDIREFLRPIHDKKTELELLAERSFLSELDGSCRTPIGSISKIDDKKIFLSGQVLKPNGSEVISGNWEGLVDKPIDLGKMAGNEIKEKIDDSFFKKENLSH